jgi:hypothetical protein
VRGKTNLHTPGGRGLSRGSTMFYRTPVGTCAIEVRDIFMPEDFFDPLLDPLRADPRFARVEKRMGITSND